MDERDPRKYYFKPQFWRDVTNVFNSARTAPVTPQSTAASLPPVLVHYIDETRLDGDLSLAHPELGEQSINTIFPSTEETLSLASRARQTANIDGINTDSPLIATLEQVPSRATGTRRAALHSRKYGSLPDLVVPSNSTQKGCLSPSPKSARHTSFSSVYSDPGNTPSHIEYDEPLERLIPNSNEISYQVNICHINAKRTKPMKNLKRFRWYSAEFYKDLNGCIDDFIQDMMVDEFKGHEIRFYYGSLRIIGQDHEYAVIIQEDAIKESISPSDVGQSTIPLAIEEPTIQLVCRCIAEHPKERFRLKYYLEFASIPKISGSGSYIGMLKNHIDSVKKANKNFEREPFVPRPDRDIFTTLDSITTILKGMDPFKSMESDRKERESKDLASKITQHKAEVMFLACMTEHSCTVAHFLQVFRNGEYNDGRLPPSEYVQEHFLPTQSEANHPSRHMDKTLYESLAESISQFFVKTIEDNGQHWELKENEIMPILHVRGKSETELGRGSSGILFKVKIVSGHHNLPEHKRSEFALKKMLRDSDPENPWDSFRRERAMLRYLRKLKDPHIVCHIMSWKQYDNCYILYPLASSNLHQYMQGRPPPVVTIATIKWFLRQLRGLVNALDQVHEQLEEPGWEQMINDSTVPTRKIGYHHDIKPENILVFERRQGYNPVFKLTDFGAGKFVSQSGEMSDARTSKPNSTPSYSGPEHDGKPSRPFDIWAMACVLTEMFIWLLLGPGELTMFSQQRYDEDNRSIKLRTYFRRRGLERRGTDEEMKHLEIYFELTPTVTEHLTTLSNICNADWRSENDFGPKGALRGLSNLILSCFKIKPEERLTAKELCRELDTFIDRAETAAVFVEVIECATPVVQPDGTGLLLASSEDVVTGAGDLFTSGS